MQSGSDTESEGESSVVARSILEEDFFIGGAGLMLATSTQNSDVVDSLGARALAATAVLELIDLTSVERDTTTHHQVHEASSAISMLLEAVISGTEDLSSAPECMSAVSYLLRVQFLLLLFEYRRLFHGLAARELAIQPKTSVVVCWVDILLSALGEAVVVIGGGMTRDGVDQRISRNLKEQRQNDALRVAAQLPAKWEAVIGLISSEWASPGAVRLSLCLTFGVYLVRPQLEECDPWSESCIEPFTLLQCLRTYMKRSAFYGSGPSAGQLYDPRTEERIGYAMIVSLFASADLAWRAANHEAQSPFHPHTLAIVLRLMRHVMDANYEHSSCRAAAVPCEILDPAQTILVHWGQIIPWCWRMWNDQRMVDSDVLTDLTATWLYHLQCPSSENIAPDLWKKSLAFNISYCAESAARAVLRQVDCLTSALCISPQSGSLPSSALDVLHKSCWALLQFEISVPHLNADCVVDMRASFCAIMVLLGDTHRELQMKTIVIQGLTLAGGENVGEALRRVREDGRFDFALRFEDSILNSRLTLEDLGGNDPDGQTALSVKLKLDFLTIIWHSGVTNLVQRQCATHFLSPLVDWLVSEPSVNSGSASMLHDALLTALGCLETQKRLDSNSECVNKLWEDPIIWYLATDVEPTNLPVASSFAQYLLATVDSDQCDWLCRLTAWDFLREVLLLILTKNVTLGDEDLATAVFPLLCRAMSQLLEYSAKPATTAICCSPWTMNLYAELGRESAERGSSLMAKQLMQRMDDMLGGEGKRVKNTTWKTQYKLLYTGSERIAVVLV